MTPRGADRHAWLAIALVALLGTLLRVGYVGTPGFPTDVATFSAWAQRLAEIGPARFYEPGYFSDYPPGFLYVLWVLGVLFQGEPLRLAIKAITIPFDLGIAALVAAYLWKRSGRRSSVIACALWLLGPGVIFAGTFWGQVDAVGTLPFLASLLAAGRKRWLLAGTLAAVSAMVKPQFGLALVVVGAAALLTYVRTNEWRPIARVVLSSVGTVLALGLPFRSGALELIGIVRGASETYPFTSLFAFNIWSIVGDFWKPDDAFFAIGALLLALGIIASCVPLWWRRDTSALLVAGAFTVFAFYFLPTRAHERYLYPALALLLPFAATRARILVPYLVLSLSFFVTLVYVFTQYQLVSAPGYFDALMGSRGGQIALALVMMGGAIAIAILLLRGEASMTPTLPTVPRVALPASLASGGPPRRRDYVLALLVALAVLATRGYRLDQPRDMYFDEVYHARTAFELLAQREPYEWTHPHLAKELMALGIIAFADDRVVGHEVPPPDVTAFAVSNDGVRVYGDRQGRILVADRGGAPRVLFTGPLPALALGVEEDTVYGANEEEVFAISLADASHRSSHALPTSRDVTAFAVLSGGRVVIGTSTLTAIYPAVTSDPVRVAIPSIGVASKPDGSELYLLEPGGSVRVVDPVGGIDSRSYASTGPARAIAYALGPNRLFLARTNEPLLDVIDLEGGHREQVPLANDRTGAFASGATALAVVPRTQFLYALADGRLVIAETHGASPYVALPTGATRIGVDGTGDTIVLPGPAAADIVETGRHALAWRLPGVVFGALLAFVLVLLTRRLFRGAALPAVVGGLVLLDGSMFAQPRIGMNDVYVAAFLVAAWYFVVAAHRPRRSAEVDLLAAGVLFGLALATKWVAAYAIAALALAVMGITALAWAREEPGRGGPLDLFKGRGLNALLLVGCFGAIPGLLYLASYLHWFGGPTAPYGWDLVELTKQMYWYHSGLTSPHPAGSPWWTWPLDLKPVYWYYAQSADGGAAVIYDAGNVVLFWGAFVATGWATVAALRARSISLGFVIFALFAQLLAWIFVSRVVFFYHFFTALPFYLMALACALVVLWEGGRRTVVAGYVALAVAAFLFFYPFVSGVPIPAAEAGIFFILPTWQYGCQFYPTFTCAIGPASDIALGSLVTRLGLPLVLAAISIALWRVPPTRIREWIAARRS
ncbi:MAG: phospholipid carrier-dependent glycosyltransferase [Chloroflexi bacterium]|nr:phospholipid carrier-dependent glycosyltransferase [Chloroflexota bacterium]